LGLRALVSAAGRFVDQKRSGGAKPTLPSIELHR
jgi:hypothetical protein